MKKRLLLTLLPLAFLVAACSGNSQEAADEASRQAAQSQSQAAQSQAAADTSAAADDQTSEAAATDDVRAEDAPVEEGLSVKINDKYFELDTQDTDPGRKASWNIMNVELTTGDVITLYVDGTATACWAEADTTKGIYPNYDERPGSTQYDSFTVTTTDTGNIYVHMNDNEASDYAIWVTPNQSEGGSSEGGSGSTPTGAPTTGFAIVVNGTDYYALYDEGAWDMDPSYNQYSYTSGIELNVDDIITFYNADENASWGTMTIDPASHGGLTQVTEGLKVGTAGTYDIYVKMKFGQDNIYVGPHLG